MNSQLAQVQFPNDEMEDTLSGGDEPQSQAVATVAILVHIAGQSCQRRRLGRREDHFRGMAPPEACLE
jgi:hypothetical protein